MRQNQQEDDCEVAQDRSVQGQSSVRSGRSTEIAIGLLLCALIVLNCLHEWQIDSEASRTLTVALLVLTVLLMFLDIPTGRRLFVIVAIAVTGLAVALLPSWQGEVLHAAGTTAFLMAFFSALAWLGEAAGQSPAIHKCGIYLAHQPPGRRYGALTLGGALFSLLLNYGSIFLLGSLATASANAEPDQVVREHRRRRMLLAVERAMGATLTWSPLALSITLTTVLIPGASWAGLLVPGLVGGAIMAGTGWAMDSLFRPRPSTGRQTLAPLPQQPAPVAGATGASAGGSAGSLAAMAPLLVLLVILGGITISLNQMTGIRVPGLVIAVVPVVSLVWTVLQERRNDALRGTARRVSALVTEHLPGMRPEIVLITMSAYIGLLGGKIFAPILADLGIDLGSLPTPVILAGLIAVVGIMGQFAMNPFLATVLMIPLLPSAEQMGIAPTALALAICAGWTVNALSSPFTAMAVILGRMGNVSPRTVAIRWNGAYTIVSGTLLAAWVVFYAMVFS